MPRRTNRSREGRCALEEVGPKPSNRGVDLHRDGLSHLQVESVRRVDLGRVGILRARPVQRVEIEARRAGLEELARRDVLAERDVGPVEGEVVVDELAEVGEAGRDLRRSAAARGDRVAAPLAVGLGELAIGPLRPIRENRNGGVTAAAVAILGSWPPTVSPREPLAEDEEALGTMLFHAALLWSKCSLRSAKPRHPRARCGESPTHDGLRQIPT
jgi:hypothetical protein